MHSIISTCSSKLLFCVISVILLLKWAKSYFIFSIFHWNIYLKNILILFSFEQVKVVQNGKLNGSNLNKNQVSVSSKKKEAEKSPSAEKPVNEKKVC